MCLFKQGYVLVLGWVFNVVVFVGLSMVLCLFWVGLSILSNLVV